MSLIGVSMLEMRQMIEQGCLPDHCEVSCPDGEHLTIRLSPGDNLGDCFTTEVSVASLNSCRDLVALVAQLRQHHHAQAQPLKAIA